MTKLSRFLVTALLLLSLCHTAIAQEPPAALPTAPPITLPSVDTPVVDAPRPYAGQIAPVIRDTKSVLSRYPSLKSAFPTRIGNTNGGTTEETPIWGHTKNWPHGPGHDAAFLRLGIPVHATRVGLEWSYDRKTILIAVKSPWNEGGWQMTYITTDGRVVGGFNNDGTFVRRDFENRTPENEWAFGAGFWIETDFNRHIWPDGDKEYRRNIPFLELKQGIDSGNIAAHTKDYNRPNYPKHPIVSGYSWTAGPEGLVIKTPTTTIYGLVGFETAVFDPENGNLAFTLNNSFVLNWSLKGSGKEVKSFAPSFDFRKYPTDPRRTPAPLTHPGPIGAFRSGGDLYVVMSENEVLLYRWNPTTRKLIPAAAGYFRPDQLPASIPDHPAIGWGQGAIRRWDKDGKLAGGWEIIDGGIHGQMGNTSVYDVSPDGVLYFLPKRSKLEDIHPVGAWRLLDDNLGALSTKNVSYLNLPDALNTAPDLEQVRIDWTSGDLLACVKREGEWRLERYAGWLKSDSREAIKPTYSVGPIALGIRSQYPWWAEYNRELGVSPDPVAGAPSAGFGSMRICGGYVFIVEAQAGGVRVHRLSDGAIAGRIADRLHQNSSFDTATQIQVTQTATEFRVSLLDFHGGSVLVWRVTKKDLAAGLLAAANLNR